MARSRPWLGAALALGLVAGCGTPARYRVETDYFTAHVDPSWTVKVEAHPPLKAYVFTKGDGRQVTVYAWYDLGDDGPATGAIAERLSEHADLRRLLDAAPRDRCGVDPRRVVLMGQGTPVRGRVGAGGYTMWAGARAGGTLLAVVGRSPGGCADADALIHDVQGLLAGAIPSEAPGPGPATVTLQEFPGEAPRVVIEPTRPRL
jgi:hypothetical protein